MATEGEKSAQLGSAPGDPPWAFSADRSIASAILDVAADAWIALDRDWRATYRNVAATTLLARDSGLRVGDDIRAALPDLADAAFVERCRRALAVGKPVGFALPWSWRERAYVATVYPFSGGLAIQIRDDPAAEKWRRIDQFGAALDSAIDAPGIAAALRSCLMPLLADRAVAGRVDERGTLVPWSPQAGTDDDSLPGVSLTAEDLATIEDGGWLAAPLAGGQGGGVILPLLRDGRLLGALLLTRHSSAFDASDIALAREIARRAAIALDALRLKGEAREALAARDYFLSVAAHELRTPLTALRAHAQLVARRRATRRLDARWLGTAVTAFERASARLELIVADLLDAARLRLDRLPVRRQSLDLAPLVREIAERQREHFLARQRLALNLPSGGCRALVDPEHLEQVLVELLHNAAKFSPAGGTIRVGLETADQGARLTVRDDGIGFPPGSADAIFEPFSRAANAGARQIRGLGLGLHRCRELVTRNGGHIRAESGGEGAGAEFSCWLPRDSG